MAHVVPFSTVSPRHKVCDLKPRYEIEPGIVLMFRALEAGVRFAAKAKQQVLADSSLFLAPRAVYRLPSATLSKDRFHQQKTFEDAIKKKGCRPLGERMLLDWLTRPETFPTGYFLIASRPWQLSVIKESVTANIFVGAQLPDNILMQPYDWLVVSDT